MTDVEERLRRALQVIADEVAIPYDLEGLQGQRADRQLAPPMTERGRHRNRWMLVAAAAAAVAIVVLLGSLVWWRDAAGPAPASPTPTTVTIDDPMGIDLDTWAGAAPAGTGSFLVFDVEHLPPGWSVTSPPAGTHTTGDPDPSNYTWAAVVNDAAGHEVYVTASNPAPPPLAGGTPLDIAGRDATINDDIVTWLAPDGRGLSVASPGASPADLAAIVQQLTTTTIDTLPSAPDASPPTIEPAVVARLAGRIDGVAWAIDSATNATTHLTLAVDGHGRRSDEGAHHVVVDTWDVNLEGLGAHGTLLYGLAPAAVDAVRVITDDATITVPVAHDADEVAVWAVPVPPGLDPRHLDLLSATGDPLNSVRLPAFLVPVDGGGRSQDRELDGTFPTINTADDDRALLPSTAADYSLDLAGATITGDGDLQPVTNAAAVWQVPDGYLSLAVGLGNESGRQGLPVGDPLEGLAGQAWWGTDATSDHREVWWERPDGALWIISLDRPGADATTDQLIDWIASIQGSGAGADTLRLDRPDVTLIRSDPAGDLVATQRTWSLDGQTIALDITLDGDAIGFINLLDVGPPDPTELLGRPAWRSLDDSGTIRIAWDTGSDGWATLYIPSDLAAQEAAIINSLSTP